jgi:hypothetical protein
MTDSGREKAIGSSIGMVCTVGLMAILAVLAKHYAIEDAENKANADAIIASEKKQGATEISLADGTEIYVRVVSNRTGCSVKLEAIGPRVPFANAKPTYANCGQIIRP